MIKRFATALVLLFFAGNALAGEDWKPLWPGDAPGANGDADHDMPALLAYPASNDTANGCGIIVCPGGGYGGLAMGHEGYDIVEWLNKRGVSAWILRYRLGSKGYHHPIQKGDVLRAIRTVRHNAAASGVDSNRIGVWGFSAGGHLASTAATHFDHGVKGASDPIERVSSRPDFAVLCYPVITMDASFTHTGSRRNLFGPDQYDNAELVELLSNEKRVTKETPPTFIFHTTEDKKVPVENAIMFYSSLRKHGVNCELHVYQKGRHGVGLAAADPILATWPARLEDWIETNNFLSETIPLRKAHAHNDYAHDRPLLDALAHGFCGVEADVYLINGQLLVAHDRKDVRPDRTLSTLYLDPLKKRISENDGHVYSDGPRVTLLIDLKTEAETTYTAVHKVLAEYSDMLTTVDHGKLRPGPLSVVISGNRPRELMASQTTRYAGMDGRIADLDSKAASHLLPMISDNWGKHFRWRGEGEMPASERKTLHAVVRQAHAAGRTVRFWATPESPKVWRELLSADVDFINTDDLSGLQTFLLKQQ
ncbi:MAG: prolyl oligopeptidase family serine peptidase [Planctomycetales bacterium]